ncbi:hypothetical protein B9Z65_5044 [Elsinoe australis]|uniref:Uncharacterized protein n=1 Tax=Elsinoe australis TaxID=40998 RepID=A0A2P7ZCX5_9PEZI|nr:hypothetical protein B9Z65_5044 [Elsinoe australis]
MSGSKPQCSATRIKFDHPKLDWSYNHLRTTKSDEYNTGAVQTDVGNDLDDNSDTSSPIINLQRPVGLPTHTPCEHDDFWFRPFDPEALHIRLYAAQIRYVALYRDFSYRLGDIGPEDIILRELDDMRDERERLMVPFTYTSTPVSSAKATPSQGSKSTVSNSGCSQ